MWPDRLSKLGPLALESDAIDCATRSGHKNLESFLKDRSRSLGLFRKDKPRNITKFHKTDLVSFSHSREGKTLSYSPINTVKQYIQL